MIADALKILEKEGFLLSIESQNIPGFSHTYSHIRKMKFYANAKAAPTTDQLQLMMIKKASVIAKVVDKYSDPKVTQNIGKHLEELVWHELRAQNFTVVGSHTNQYCGKKWIRSRASLDHIAEHNTGRLVIGVEVKNRLSIMSEKEIREKIEMCKHLGIVPVFAVRWNKPYIDYIRRRGGYCWVFKTQMYPLGYEELVQEVHRRLSVPERRDSKGHNLDFPVSVRSRLPEKPTRNFKQWVESQVDS